MCKVLTTMCKSLKPSLYTIMYQMDSLKMPCEEISFGEENIVSECPLFYLPWLWWEHKPDDSWLPGLYHSIIYIWFSLSLRQGEPSTPKTTVTGADALTSPKPPRPSQIALLSSSASSSVVNSPTLSTHSQLPELSLDDLQQVLGDTQTPTRPAGLETTASGAPASLETPKHSTTPGDSHKQKVKVCYECVELSLYFNFKKTHESIQM